MSFYSQHKLKFRVSKLVLLSCLAALSAGCQGVLNSSYAAGNTHSTQAVKTADKKIVKMKLDDIHSKLMAGYKYWAHVPYVFGGDSHKGIDCSAFVMRIYQEEFHIQLPRTTYYQQDVGKYVPESELKPGDLILFKIAGPTGRHIGIYLGNHLFMESSSSHGVTIANLDYPYWQQHYMTARRVLNLSPSTLSIRNKEAKDTRTLNPPVTVAGQNGTQKYRVKSGDTLYGIAASTGIDYKVLAELNGLKSPYALSVGEMLILPKSYHATESIPSTAAPQSSTAKPKTHQYTVKSGDTLYDIAKASHLSYQAIAKANHLKAPYTLHIGEQLTLPAPVSPTPHTAAQVKAVAVSKATKYTVQSGDTLYDIAKASHISYQAIAKANHLKAPYTLHIGEQLTLPAPVSPTPHKAAQVKAVAVSKATKYTVKSGDTLYDIAKASHLSYQAIAKANHLQAPYTLHIGEQLTLPAPVSPTSHKAAQVKAVAVSKTTEYTVQSGDTLYDIAKASHISYQAIAKANHLKAPYTLHIGEQLSLPAPVSHTSHKAAQVKAVAVSKVTKYTVQSGDTLYDIAKASHLSYQAIAKANHLKAPYTLHIGEKLLLPKTA